MLPSDHHRAPKDGVDSYGKSLRQEGWYRQSVTPMAQHELDGCVQQYNQAEGPHPF